MKKTFLYSLLAIISATASATGMSELPGGTYRPLYLAADAPLTKVGPFKLDKPRSPTANFTNSSRKTRNGSAANPAANKATNTTCRIGKKPPAATPPKKSDLNKPVVFVSWFAANAYCTAQGKHLPTINQWEFAGQASELKPNGANEKAYRDTILNWYAQGSRSGLRDVGRLKPNYWGIYDMHGLIWEWTEDFNSSLLNSGGVDSSMFCSGAAAGATDPSNYAAFLRYGFRTSLQSKFSVHNLGFRCAE